MAAGEPEMGKTNVIVSQAPRNPGKGGALMPTAASPAPPTGATARAAPLISEKIRKFPGRAGACHLPAQPKL